MSDSDSSSSSSGEEEEERREGEHHRPTKKHKPDAMIPAPLEVAPPISQEIRSKQQDQKPVIVLLDQARLETVKNRRGNYELLNCDDHRELCKKKLKLDPNLYRPDICHQELLALLDSPLNKAGHLQIYIKTCKNVLIEINPSIRIPRTFKRFSGLMVQLLHKMKIKAGSESTVLLKVIKNPFSQYLPAGTRVYGMSSQGTLYSPHAMANNLLGVVEDDLETTDADETTQPPVCFIVGAMSTGHVTVEDHPYIEKMISISEYPLSGAAALSRIVGAIEHRWGIV